ncbi:hypothetical protein [Georgenia yuyongxinii]
MPRTGGKQRPFLTRTCDRLLPTGVAHLNQPGPTRLRTASHAYDAAIEDLVARSGLAA